MKTEQHTRGPGAEVPATAGAGDTTPSTAAFLTADLLGVISPYSARMHRIVPVAINGELLVVLSDMPWTPERARILEFYLGRPVVEAKSEFAGLRARFQELLAAYCASLIPLNDCHGCDCPDRSDC